MHAKHACCLSPIEQAVDVMQEDSYMEMFCQGHAAHDMESFDSHQLPPAQALHSSSSDADSTAHRERVAGRSTC